MTTQAKKRKPVHRLPSNRQFFPAVNDKDALKKTIRTHHLIESALVRGIRKALVRPDAIDLKNLQFPVKVSLATALGKSPPELGPALLKINTIRNTFAHNPSTRLTRELANDLWNCLPVNFHDELRIIFKGKWSGKPSDVLTKVLGIVFLTVRDYASGRLAYSKK